MGVQTLPDCAHLFLKKRRAIGSVPIVLMVSIAVEEFLEL